MPKRWGRWISSKKVLGLSGVCNLTIQTNKTIKLFWCTASLPRMRRTIHSLALKLSYRRALRFNQTNYVANLFKSLTSLLLKGRKLLIIEQIKILPTSALSGNYLHTLDAQNKIAPSSSAAEPPRIPSPRRSWRPSMDAITTTYIQYIPKNPR